MYTQNVKLRGQSRLPLQRVRNLNSGKVYRTGAGRRALAGYNAMFDTVIVGGRTSGSIPCHSRRGELEDGAALSGRRGRRFHVGDGLATG